MNTSNSQWSHFPADVQRTTVRVHRVKQYLVMFVYLTICHFIPCAAQAEFLNPEQSGQVISNGCVMFVQNLVGEDVAGISTGLNQGVKFGLKSLNDSISGLPTLGSLTLVDPNKNSEQSKQKSSEDISLGGVAFDAFNCALHCFNDGVQLVTSYWWFVIAFFWPFLKPSDSSNSSGKGR